MSDGRSEHEAQGHLRESPAHRAGLYSGFDGYRTPSQSDITDVLTSGLIVLDANVLLNLYRYTTEAREDLLSVMGQLGDRLFVPHQAVKEFWRNRESVLRDPRDTLKTKSELVKQRQETLRSLRTWFNRVYFSAVDAGSLVASVDALYDDIEARIAKFSVASSSNWARDTEQDEVLLRLAPILEGKVGPPLPEEDYESAVVEGLRRVEAQIPPGYRDKNKDDTAAAGDFLIWEQSLREAAKRSCNLLIVTGDVKEDWWREESGERRGPRLELVEECRARTGHMLFMLRPTQLLDSARTALAVTIREQSVQDAQRVDEIASSTTESLLNGGWNATAISHLMEWLSASAPVQANVVFEAAQQGGFISRERVYELGGYSEDRSLKGFTKPIGRFSQQLRDRGEIDRKALDPIWTVYNRDSSSVGWAVGFRIHPDVLPLFQMLRSKQEFTWLQAAEMVMRGTNRDWTVDEILDEIELRGLRDLANAATPAATLRRDLAYRGQDLFEKVGPSTFRLLD